MSHAPDFLGFVIQRWRRTDRVVRMMIVNWAVGMAVGVCCAALLLAIDFDGVESLLWRSDAAILGSVMLASSFAFTFGGLVAAAAAMRADEDIGARRGGRHASRLIPQRAMRKAR